MVGEDGCISEAPALGAFWNSADGTARVAVLSDAADHGAHDQTGEVVLCILAEDDSERRVELSRQGDTWTATDIKHFTPGTRYGFRASGLQDESQGLRYDPKVLLSDPWARAFAPNPGDPRRLWSVLVEDDFDWGDDAGRPRRPLDQTVVYETHVRGLTMLHPDVPPPLRGTYAGLTDEAVLTHLRRLGVTAVELLPVHQHVTEQFLLERGLTNYWGYQTLGFFAPDFRYSSAGSRGAQVREFKQMVLDLHAAGFEVILDVVYNHTAEGGVDQPDLSFRGLGNRLYYECDPHDRAKYVDYTGCGNSLDVESPTVQRLILESLRYWVEEMHVDGFRFDLASALLRRGDDYEPTTSFLRDIREAVGEQVKLIAEPWTADGGYELGHFPAPWSQWDDKFRDAASALWVDGRVGDMAARLAGSCDLVVQGVTAGPTTFVNYVASHDNRTAWDRVCYGAGSVGPSLDPSVHDEQLRRVRGLLCMPLLARGVPMILGGDERLRSQQGIDDGYTLDNPLGWYDWTSSAAADGLTDLLARVLTFRRHHLVADASWSHQEMPGDSQLLLGHGRCPGRTNGQVTHQPHPLLVLVNAGARTPALDLTRLDPAAVLDLGSELAFCSSPHPADRGPVDLTGLTLPAWSVLALT